MGGSIWGGKAILRLLSEPGWMVARVYFKAKLKIPGFLTRGILSAANNKERYLRWILLAQLALPQKRLSPPNLRWPKEDWNCRIRAATLHQKRKKLQTQKLTLPQKLYLKTPLMWRHSFSPYSMPWKIHGTPNGTCLGPPRIPHPRMTHRSVLVTMVGRGCRGKNFQNFIKKNQLT